MAEDYSLAVVASTVCSWHVAVAQVAKLPSLKRTPISRPVVKGKIKTSQSGCDTTKHKAMPPSFLQT